MASGDDAVICFSGSEAKDPDDDTDAVLGFSEDESPAAAGHARAGRVRPAPTTADFGIWILDSPYKPVEVCAAGPASLAGPAAQPRVVGLAVCKWQYVEGAGVVDGGDDGVHARGSVSRARPPWGHVQYSALRAWMLEEPKAIPEGLEVSDDACCFELSEAFS